MAEQGLEPIDAESLREHYAKTLWHWVDRLEAHADAARAEVGDERYRIWRIYMAGSAHAFDRGWLSLWQVLAGKPHAGRSPAASAHARLHVRERTGHLTQHAEIATLETGAVATRTARPHIGGVAGFCI